MEIPFVKMHGLGNDFVFIDDMDRAVELTADQVAAICDRHFGVGADGVILVRPDERAECAAYMHYINADGSLAQMCGNGVRCFAKYLVDHRIVDPAAGSFTAGTLAGPRPITFTTDDEGRMIEATVDMGEPVLEPAKVPTTLEVTAQAPTGAPYAKDVPVDSPWGPFAFTCVSMGNPHAVTFVEDFNALDDALFDDPAHKSLETMNIQAIGRFYESNPAFPEKTNVEFIDVREDGLHMRVYERGDGETLACGTGACATNVAAALTGRAGRRNDVILRGGTLHIDWAANDHVMMTGPAAVSFTGTLTVE